jgi:hypothetical protein
VSSHITVNNALFAVPKKTEHKRTEEDVRRSEAFLAEGERLSHTGTWGLNVASGDVLWSQKHFRIFDVDPRETKPSLELFWQKAHPEDRVRLQQLLEEAVQERKDFASDFRIVLSNGTPNTFTEQAMRLLIAQGVWSSSARPWISRSANRRKSICARANFRRHQQSQLVWCFSQWPY